MKYLFDKGTNKVLKGIFFGANFYTSNYREATSSEIIDYRKKILISKIKEECSKRISSRYDIYDQLNYCRRIIEIQNKENLGLKNNVPYTLTTDEVTIMSESNTGSIYIEGCLLTKDTMISDVNALTTVSDLDSFDFKSDNLWPL